MRTSEEVGKTLNLIFRIWKAHPYMRLTELLKKPFEGIHSGPTHFANCEDGELERKLIETYGDKFLIR